MYAFHYVDAFTTTPFEGNPCAVFPEAEGLETAEMQELAKETNLSETSFVFPSTQADFKVRYFTPRDEIPFAGHPTIATAFLLAQQGFAQLSGASTVLRFEFNIGVLPVQILRSPDGGVEQVGMQQQPPEFRQTIPAAKLAPLLSLEVDDFIEGVPGQVVSTGVPFLMIPLKSVRSVKAADMDRPRLLELLTSLGVDAMLVFAPQGYTSEGDTFARLLDPKGAGEDPYTGSATGCMGSFLYHHGIIERQSLICEQGHLLGRPGSGRLELEGTPEHISAVHLFGSAATSLRGYYERS